MPGPEAAPLLGRWRVFSLVSMCYASLLRLLLCLILSHHVFDYREAAVYLQAVPHVYPRKVRYAGKGPIVQYLEDRKRLSSI